MKFSEYWYSIAPGKRRWILFGFLCFVVELVLRFEGIDGVHFYNFPVIALRYIHFFERCYPPDQQERLGGLMRAIHVFHRAAEKHGLRYWVDYGTLLGCLRNGELIPWDFDADLGVVKKEWEAKPGVKKDMEAAGYEVRETKDCRVFIWTDRARGMKIDIFQNVYRPSDGFFFRCRITDTFRYHFPVRYVEKTKLLSCGGDNVRIPQDTWDFIYKWRYPSARYSQLPLKFWCYFTSVRFFFTLVAMLLFVIVPIAACITVCCRRL